MALCPGDERSAGELRPVVGSDSSGVTTEPGGLVKQPDHILAADAVVHRDADLRRIYTATTAKEAVLMLGEFEARWDAEYLPIGQSRRRNWSRLTPFFDYPPQIRKVIYTTNVIESVNMSLRKLTKNRGSFPSDEALTKLFYLALRNISQKWAMPIRDWKAALTRFAIQFGDRICVN